MAIRYIDGPEARITDHDGLLVDVEFYGNGEVLRGLEPRRLFPISGLGKYITLLDGEGVEQAVVRDINGLMEDSKRALEKSLAEYYMIPKIKRLVKMTEKFKIWMWTAETDRGTYTFEIRDHHNTVKPLYDGRVLIRDANDNRYEIPDVDALDSRSRRMILPNL